MNSGILESYPLRGLILGSGAPVTNAVGASEAINGMKRGSVTHVHTEGRTDRREGGNSSLDLERKFLIGFENFILKKISHGMYVCCGYNFEKFCLLDFLATILLLKNI